MKNVVYLFLFHWSHVSSMKSLHSSPSLFQVRPISWVWDGGLGDGGDVKVQEVRRDCFLWNGVDGRRCEWRAWRFDFYLMMLDGSSKNMLRLVVEWVFEFLIWAGIFFIRDMWHGDCGGWTRMMWDNVWAEVCRLCIQNILSMGWWWMQYAMDCGCVCWCGDQCGGYWSVAYLVILIVVIWIIFRCVWLRLHCCMI